MFVSLLSNLIYLSFWELVSLCVGWVSSIASAIGIPLHTGLTTLMCQRLTYTRICIKINASKMICEMEENLIFSFQMVC